MGWETRQRGTEYYYRSVRIDGRPRRIYLGTGEVGRAHELFDQREQQNREAKQAARRELHHQFDECARLWKATWPLVRAVSHAILILSGWYSHHGEWRKVMGKPRTRKSKDRPATPQESEDLRAQLVALSTKANTGDNAALTELRTFLDAHPEVWQQLGDLNRLSTLAWINPLASRDALRAVHQESIARYIADWKTQLAGPSPTPIEQALIDTAAVAKLALTHAECSAAADSGSLDTAGFKIKRLDAAVRRQNATLKLLTQVRAACPQGLVPSSPQSGPFPRLYQSAKTKQAC